MEYRQKNARMGTEYEEQNRRHHQEYLDAQRERPINDQLAYEAGEKLDKIPREALGHESAIKAYGEGLDEREMAANPHPSVTPSREEMQKIAERRELLNKAMIEAVAIREKVQQEYSASSTVHYSNPITGNTYQGRIIGSTENFVIQANDNRTDSVVLHERKVVSGLEKVQQNERAEIKYPYQYVGIVRDSYRSGEHTLTPA